MDSNDLVNIITNNSRIILPDFGAFLLKDSENNEFKPENITFSPFLKYNDGVLEEYFAKSKGITKEESIKQIKAFIEQVKKQINESGYFTIEGIGKLTRNNRGAIIFVAEGSNTDPLNPSNQSSKPKRSTKRKSTKSEQSIDIDNNPILNQAPNTIDLIEMDQQIDIDNTEETTSNNEEFSNAISNNEIQDTNPSLEPDTIATNTSSEIVTEKETTMNMTKTKKKSSLRPLLIFIGASFVTIIILAFIIRSFVVNNNEIVVDPIPVAPTEIEAKPTAEETTASKPKDEIDKAFDEMNAEDNTNKTTTTKEQAAVEEQIEKSVIENASQKNQTKEQFYLVVGSFKDISNAEKYSKQLKSEGYKSEVIPQSGKNYVTVGSFATKEKATEEKNNLIKKFSSVWILKK